MAFVILGLLVCSFMMGYLPGFPIYGVVIPGAIVALIVNMGPRRASTQSSWVTLGVVKFLLFYVPIQVGLQSLFAGLFFLVGYAVSLVF